MIEIKGKKYYVFNKALFINLFQESEKIFKDFQQATDKADLINIGRKFIHESLSQKPSIYIPIIKEQLEEENESLRLEMLSYEGIHWDYFHRLKCDKNSVYKQLFNCLIVNNASSIFPNNNKIKVERTTHFFKWRSGLLLDNDLQTVLAARLISKEALNELKQILQIHYLIDRWNLAARNSILEIPRLMKDYFDDMDYFINQLGFDSSSYIEIMIDEEGLFKSKTLYKGLRSRFLDPENKENLTPVIVKNLRKVILEEIPVIDHNSTETKSYSALKDLSDKLLSSLASKFHNADINNINKEKYELLQKSQNKLFPAQRVLPQFKASKEGVG